MLRSCCSLSLTLFVASLGFAADPPDRAIPPAPSPVRDAVIEILQANDVNLDGLTNGPKTGGPFVNLGTGRNGAPVDNATDANLGLIANLVEIERLSFYKGSFTPEGLANLAALPKLRAVQFYGVKADPKAFLPLKNFKNLESVQISEFPLTDEVLGALGGVARLKSLEINQTQRLSSAALAKFLESAEGLESLLVFGNVVDDACLERIGQLKALKRFWTDSKTISPQAWRHLAGLTDMRGLFLRGTSMNDEGMRSLEKMTGLRVLMLDGTQVTDAGMSSLAGLTNMEDLGLVGTKITDAGMVHLKDMNRLHNLYVSQTKVTARGLLNVPQKEQMRMMRVGQRGLAPGEFAEISALFPNSEIFDPSGYWSPDRVKAAFPERPTLKK
jgi:hypothetical protein